jgi:hypothetical protein
VPRVNKPYGHRFRDCFETSPGWVFVCADMEVLERRDFGLQMAPIDGGADATALLSGNSH